MRFLHIQIGMVLLLNVGVHAEDVESLVARLALSPASKAIIQWERVFKSERKMKRYKINTLSVQDRKKLQEYLIRHAIDSDMPTVAGES